MSCCVGRSISRHDDLAGLDWRTPCESAAVEALLLGSERDEYSFCRTHANVIFDQLAAHFLATSETGLE